jgi:hypothetical protein
MMSKQQLHEYALNVHIACHEYAKGGEIAFYALDLLQQGYTAKAIIEKLKKLLEIAVTANEPYYVDAIDEFIHHVKQHKTPRMQRWVLKSPKQEMQELIQQIEAEEDGMEEAV